MKKLYLECYSGISGDMTVAALLDLGADREVLMHALHSLPVQEFDIKISRVKKAGLDVCDFDVLLDEAHENHDHDMEYLHGHEHSHEEYHHDHEHSHEEHHHHDHEHSHEEHHHDHHHDGEHSAHGHHAHSHRGMKEIMEILEKADLTDRARATAVKIFTILGRAEAKAHGTTLEEVHFHEVGAVDSIVDIVAAAVCLDNLGIEQVIIPFLYEGGGTIRCQHGILPVPVPAVANIAAAEHLKLHLTGENGEYVTPTGAAIAAAIRTSDVLPEVFTIEKIGLGAGKREYERPGILRALLIDAPVSSGNPEEEMVWKLESDIDDCSGEVLGFTMEQLMKAGAREVHYVPVQMKKNRPAYELCVLCLREDIPVMEQIIFANTTTIGIRRCRMGRTVLEREMQIVDTPYGKAHVKICTIPGCEGTAPVRRCYPEYESVSELCRTTGKSYEEMYHSIVSAWNERTLL